MILATIPPATSPKTTFASELYAAGTKAGSRKEADIWFSSSERWVQGGGAR
jgi:hypothetical protein